MNAMDKLVEKITQNKTITPDSKKILRDMLLNLVTEVRSIIKNPVRRAERNERIANAYNKTLAVVKDQFGIEIYRALKLSLFATRDPINLRLDRKDRLVPRVRRIWYLQARLL